MFSIGLIYSRRCSFALTVGKLMCCSFHVLIPRPLFNGLVNCRHTGFAGHVRGEECSGPEYHARETGRLHYRVLQALAGGRRQWHVRKGNRSSQSCTLSLQVLLLMHFR